MNPENDSNIAVAVEELPASPDKAPSDILAVPIAKERLADLAGGKRLAKERRVSTTLRQVLTNFSEFFHVLSFS